jgi:hypothetical protein
MATMQCTACNGTYDDALGDGTQYFHTCPPLSAWEVRAAIPAGASPLSPAQAKQLAIYDALADDPVSGATGRQRGDAYLASLTLARPGHRDENVDPAKVARLRDRVTGNLPNTVTDAALMVSVGAGAVELADDAAAQ